MKTMYRSCLLKIKAVQIERESIHSVWVKGRQRAKVTGWDNYHDTWEDAHTFLIAEGMARVKTKIEALSKAEKALRYVSNLKPSDLI